MAQIVQPTAALIVLGGTLGALLLQFPMSDILVAAQHLRHVLLESETTNSEVVEQMVSLCSQVRRRGMLTLDAQLEEVQDPFLRRALTLAVDGVEAREIREVLELELCRMEEEQECAPHVLEAAGGFSPTLGIVGAVLGLIQVMQRMDNIGAIGKGIAASFVSTLYGIGMANLLFLPLAGKLRIRSRERQVKREIVLEAVTAMVEGIGSLGLRQRLQAYVVQQRGEAQELPVREVATR